MVCYFCNFTGKSDRNDEEIKVKEPGLQRGVSFRNRLTVQIEEDGGEADAETLGTVGTYPTTPSKPSTPAELDAYQVLKPLGRGAHGQVMLIRNKKSRLLYAAKVLMKKAVIRENQVEGTKSERKILESVRHPFIVYLHTAFQCRNALYLVIEYCPGGELLDLIRKAGQLPESSAQFYGAAILLAVEELHNCDILYRDLKPENVLIDRDGYAKLSDFGLSKDNFSARGRAATMVGTEEYMAPEVLRAEGYGQPADWYSFGCLIHEMLVGEPPRDPLQSDTRAQTLVHNWPALSTVAAEVLVGLLQENQKNRLGAKGGLAKLKRDRFFIGLNFEELKGKQVQAPWIPEMPSDDDDDDLEPDLPMFSQSKVSVMTNPSDETFSNFNYVNPGDDQDDATGEEASTTSLVMLENKDRGGRKVTLVETQGDHGTTFAETQG